MVHDQLRLLLQEHDCVTLPGLGALLAEPVPTRIHPIRHTLSPPARRLGFTDQLRHNDGLLTAAVRRALPGPEQEAAPRRVQSFTDELKAALRKAHKAELPGLGTLYQASASDSIRFEALDPGLLPQPDSFGLPELVARPVVSGRPWPAPATQLRIQRSWLRRLLGTGVEPVYRLATAAAVLLGASAAYFSFHPSPLVARLLPGLENPTAQNQPPPATPLLQRAAVAEELSATPGQLPTIAPTVAVAPEVRQPTEPVTTPAVTTPETTPAAEAAAPAVTSPVPATKAAPTLVSKPTGRYHLVWNAFSSRRQADKGYAAACRIAGDGQTLPLILAPQRGGRLYRVVVGDYASAAEAAQDLPRQRARFGSALWVLRY